MAENSEAAASADVFCVANKGLMPAIAVWFGGYAGLITFGRELDSYGRLCLQGRYG